MKQPGKSISRRTFIQTTALSTAALCGPVFITKSIAGANDRLRVAVLGVNGRGQDHIDGFMKLDNVDIATLCDPDANVLAGRAKQFEERYKKRVNTIQEL